MKVLWMSNVSLTAKKINKSGTWIHSMYRLLKCSPGVDIACNITLGTSNEVVKEVSEGISQYFIPQKGIDKKGLPSSALKEQIIQIIEDEKPDLIHVWGIELFWGIIATSPRMRFIPHLIELQGIKGVISNPLYFFGGLSPEEIKQTRRLLEYLYPKQYVVNLQHEFAEWGKIETEILALAKNVNTQSDWVRTIVGEMVGPNARIFNTGIILRQEFTDSDTWWERHVGNDEKVLFCVTDGRIYKAPHVILKAFAIVKKHYPKAVLRIAGLKFNPNRLKNSGYNQYLQELMRILGIEDSVILLGNIEASQMLEEFYKADVCVNASFVETYCLALAEALCVGVPCVAPYTSALTELMDDAQSGLYYPMGDYIMCADKIMQFLSDEGLSIKVSQNASKTLRTKSDAKAIAHNQIEIYRSILSDAE